MTTLDLSNLREFLEESASRFNQPGFIENDPVSIPHSFTRKEDIEISGFLAATLSWGNRKAILRAARQLMDRMGNEPHRFLVDASDIEFKPAATFIYRTFNGDDCLFFLEALKQIYRDGPGLESLFSTLDSTGAARSIHYVRTKFLEVPHLKRSEKHLADPLKGSAAKRMNMFLRWMVRKDSNGVDFGLWPSIRPSSLVCPLDVHTGRTARKIGLLHRPQNDWQSAIELTENLRRFDPDDPVKYDFALFGLSLSDR